MKKYVGLDSVLRGIPSTIINELDTTTIKSWAIEFFRRFTIPTLDEEVVPVAIIIEDHKAKLPDDIVRVLDVRYRSEFPVNYRVKDIDPDKLLIYQRIFFEGDYFNLAKPLKYIGQHRGSLIEEELWCNDCADGFSVDAMMRCLTTTMADGNVLLIYTRYVSDENGNLLIPDDSVLRSAISYFVQSMYWEERKFSGVANAHNYQNDALMKATMMANRFKAETLQAGIDPDRHRSFTFNRNFQFSY